MKTIQKGMKMAVLLLAMFSIVNCGKKDDTLTVVPHEWWTETNPSMYQYSNEGKTMIFFIVPEENFASLVGYEGMTELVVPSQIKYKSNKWVVKSVGTMRGINRTDELKKITTPTTVEFITHNAFENCKQLKEVNLAEGLHTIGEDAFSNCQKLDEMVFPSTLKKICPDAFYGCNHLRQLFFQSEVPPTLRKAFMKRRSPYYEVFVPEKYLNTYEDPSIYQDKRSMDFYYSVHKFIPFDFE